MSKIKNIAFDLGGVVLALSYEQAVRRFEEIGLANARQHLDAFEQKGIFGDLESGRISPEDFRRELSKLIGREVTMDATRLGTAMWTMCPSAIWRPSSVSESKAIRSVCCPTPIPL